MEGVYRPKNRNGVDIIARMLRTSDEGATRTQLMYRVNLSFKLLERYLGTIIALNLVDIGQVNGRQSYRTNQKGHQFLKHYRALTKMMYPDGQKTEKRGTQQPQRRWLSFLSSSRKK